MHLHFPCICQTNYQIAKLSLENKFLFAINLPLVAEICDRDQRHFVLLMLALKHLYRYNFLMLNDFFISGQKELTS